MSNRILVPFILLTGLLWAQAPKVQVTTRGSNPITSIQSDQNFLELQHAANASIRSWGNKEASNTGLIWSYFGGPAFKGSTWTTVGDGIVPLTASSTNYIERTVAGVVTANVTGWSAGKIPMATVITGTDSISSQIDFRGAPSAAAIGFSQPFIGAAQRTQADKNAETVSILDFTGADPSGTSDSTTALSAAQKAVPAGGTILFPAGGKFKIGSVNFNGKSCLLIGYGATILCTSANGAIFKTDHGNKLSVYGLAFTSSSPGARAINYQTTPGIGQDSDLFVFKSSFNMNNAFGIYCVGTRSAKVVECEFYDKNSGDGIYFKDANAPYLVNSHFYGTSYNRRAVYYPGTGAGTDCGLVIRDCEIMGWNQGIEVIGCDLLFLFGSTVDYNLYSIKLDTQDGAMISGNYIGTHTSNPALWITASGVGSGYSPNYSDSMIIEGNSFTGHWLTDNTYDNVLIDGTVSPTGIMFRNNQCLFYTRYGVNFTINGQLNIDDNRFAPASGHGVAPIHNSTGRHDSQVSIKRNTFPVGTTIAAMNLSLAAVNENLFCITEARGLYSTSGVAGQFNNMIPHGCAYTPAISDIQLTPCNLEAVSRGVYVASVDATSITLGFTTATTTTVASFAWRVRRGL